MTETADDFHMPPVVPHGPGVARWFACEYGASGHCAAGKHEKCAHNWGSPHAEGGPGSPSAYLEHNVDGRWSVVVDENARPVVLLPLHVWRCSCAHHTPAGATDLLGFL